MQQLQQMGINKVNTPAAAGTPPKGKGKGVARIVLGTHGRLGIGDSYTGRIVQVAATGRLCCCCRRCCWLPSAHLVSHCHPCTRQYA